MNKSEYLDFYTCFMDVTEFQTASFFSYWSWQTDPWKCGSTAEGKRVITLKREIDSNRSDSNFTEVGKLGRGLFQCVISADALGNTLWEYRWISKNETISTFWMSADRCEICLLNDNSMTAGFQPYVFLNQLMPTIMLDHDALSFHGVLMEHDGSGFILSAASGTGKTIHARLWRDHKRALILNGDRATCTKEADGSWTGFSLPWSGTSGEQINRDVPLTAFVQIEQAPENTAERLTGIEAFNAVMPNLLYPGWNRELTIKALDFVDDFLKTVPVFKLRCRPDAEAVEVLDHALRGSF